MTAHLVDDGCPTFLWGCAPDGLLTRRQLRLIGLHPGTAEPAGRITFTYYRQPRTAWLYPITDARPVHPFTPARAAALAAAMTARRTCPDCRQDVGYVIPGRYGRCLDCLDCHHADRPASTLPTATGAAA